MNGVEIIHQWRHEDLSLEDFGFTIEVNGEVVRLDFYDGADWVRSLRSLDGVIVSKQYDFQKNAYEHVYLSDSALKGIELKQGGLIEAVEHLSEILEVARNSTPTWEQRVLSGRWGYIYCELDERARNGHLLLTTSEEAVDH